MKEYLNRETSYAHSLEDLIQHVKMAVLPNFDLLIQCSLQQNPRNWQADPKIHVEMQGIQNGQNNLEKNNTIVGLTCSFKAIAIKTVWHYHEDQWNGIQSPEVNPTLLWSVDF